MLQTVKALFPLSPHLQAMPFGLMLALSGSVHIFSSDIFIIIYILLPPSSLVLSCIVV